MSGEIKLFTGCCTCGGDSCESAGGGVSILMMMTLAAIIASVAAFYWLPPLAAGLVMGVGALGACVWAVMPRLMIVRHRSRYGLDETIERLVAAIEARGWRVPAVRNMNKSMAEQGVEFPRQVRLVELCKAAYAADVLSGDRHLATLMPCAFAVYEDDEGSVRISGMNTGLMGRMFGGKVAEVMGHKVAADERAFLASVVKGGR